MEKAKDYHGHPNYLAVYLVLVAIFGVSVVIGEVWNTHLGIAMIFALAVVKAIFVLGNFMHLRWEPKLLWVVMGFAFLCLAFAFFGILPDIVPIKHVVTK